MNGRTNSSDVTINEIVVNNGALIPLEAPTGFTSTVDDQTISFNYTDPVDKVASPGGELVAEFDHTIVVRKQGSQPTGPTDGDVVINSTTRNQYSGTPYIDNGLINDTQYHYGIYTYSKYGVVSDPLFGSATPTYFASISFDRVLYSSISTAESIDGLQATASNGRYAFFAYTESNMMDYEQLCLAINDELVSNNLVPQFSQAKTSARIGNNALIFTDSDSWLGSSSYYIDGALVQHALGQSFIGIPCSASVNNLIAYTFTSNDEGSGMGYRYDSNLLNQSIGVIPDSNSGPNKQLSGKNYAFFSGYTHFDSLNNNYEYLDTNYVYDINGTRKSFKTEYCRGSWISTSNCDEYALIYGGSSEYRDRTDSEYVYSVSKDLLVSELAKFEDPQLVGTFASHDAPTNGLGIVIVHKTSGYEDTQIITFDKRLVNTGAISNIPTGSSGGLRVSYEVQIPRAGDYIFIPNQYNFNQLYTLLNK